MKTMYGLVLCSVLVLGMVMPSMAGGDEVCHSKRKHHHVCKDRDCANYFRTKRLPHCAFNEAGYNWDGMAWDRGGYFRDYYPHARSVR